MPQPPSLFRNDDTASTLARAGVTCIERGWLSANNILVRGDGPTALVDSGYSSHAEQTVALVAAALDGQPLDLLLNTHLHSDHCGGNAALQEAHPALRTLIPPGQAASVIAWDAVALTYEPTGQSCPRFTHDGLMTPGSTIRLGSLQWEIHAAAGHDPHSIVLFQADHRLLMSADALWGNGFGIVFPELDGDSAFDEVAATLDLIERLAPTTVLPGHGPVFTDVDGALARARSRLDQFVKHPDKHRRHALKVLIKFKLLEWQSVSVETMLDWALATPYFFCAMPLEVRTERPEARVWLNQLLLDLEKANVLSIEGRMLVNQ
jgi:glyoxylase-like metal-dependent hydrolase (beta-lactamase superfamily II)